VRNRSWVKPRKTEKDVVSTNRRATPTPEEWLHLSQEWEHAAEQIDFTGRDGAELAVKCREPAKRTNSLKEGCASLPATVLYGNVLCL
jgi:hypothetical protein